MKHYRLIVLSKTKKSITDFVNFLDNKKINFNLIKKHFIIKKKKKITILKSPHVNKTAQEQFQLIFFRNQITIYSDNISRSLIFLKKIQNNLFSDLKIIIKFATSKNLLALPQTKILNPTNFKFNDINKFSNKRKKIKIYTQINSLLGIFDFYSEILKKKV